MAEPERQTSATIPWYALPIEEVQTRLHATPDGLSAAEAQHRLETYGPNELATAPGPSLGSLVLKQLRSPLIYMLLAAALISFFAENPVDAVVILAVVVLNTVVGVVQEWRAEQALEALRQLAAPRARVLRDGETCMIHASEVVPGDILILESGDRASADARLLEAINLYIDESALTGESRPVEKAPGIAPARIALADRTNMAWMSTAITGGRGRAVVVATGMQTVIGEIASEVRETRREETPLQRQIGHLGTTLGIIAIALAAVIFIVGVIRPGIDHFEILIFAVAAAVSAIPEGLPAVISVVLALGVQRMAAHHAIIRRLPAVETLGSTTVICSDKTGTITRNEMTVTRIWAGGRVFTVSGEGFSPEGAITLAEGETPEASAEVRHPSLDALIVLGCVANDATLEHTGSGWAVEGDPTEGALLVAARKAGISPEELQDQYVRLDEIPFTSKAKYMATLNESPVGGQTALFVKGAPERILNFCSHILIRGRRLPLTDEWRERLLDVNMDFAKAALRVLAGAYREFPAGHAPELSREEAERDLTLLGLWGMLDPPRPDAIAAVRAALHAGINIKMITGDHAVTAAAIAHQVGIATHGEETVTGEELEEMPDEELRRRVEHIGVFARVSPSHKLRIVDALRANGQIVAMTGDGVNDAPALKRASIGVAMGTGTEVAKESADMVLTDDNFATMVHAVEEGRVIFTNLRKVVFFLITTNLGEILTLATALIIGLPLPLTAVMILWVNLVTDGLCTAPLGVEPKHWDVLSDPPRDPKSGIIDRRMLRRMALLSPLMAVGTLLLFWRELSVTTYSRAQTIAFTTLVAFQWFHALNSRSHRSSLFRIGLFTNPWLLTGIGTAVLLQVIVIYLPWAEVVFNTTALSWQDWGLIVLVASSIFWVDEILKLFHVHESRH